jgi:signal transduction histidine kinase
MDRVRPFRPARLDLVLGLCVLALSQAEVWGYGAGGGTVVAALALGLCGAAMAWRTTHPILVAVVVAIGLTLCATFSGEPFSATSVLTFDLAFFSIGAMPDRRLSLGALAVALPVSALAVHPFSVNNYLAIALASILTPWLLGLLWLRHTSARDAERRQQQAAEQAVAEERIRLARELHDVVSHNVGMIAVQAGAAEVLLDKDPEASRSSLQAIEHGARQTLLELRHLLGLLRDDDPDRITSRAALDDLPRLIEPVARAGVRVSVRSTGQTVRLPAELELTAYRIVQEALTNVVAHAAPCQVEVVLDYGPEQLGIQVTDDGPGLSERPRAGHGLPGIRERVAAVGGSVTVGPGRQGGFAVRAMLPLGER